MVSGGVDSSFSLYLLKRRGFDVVSVFLWMYDGQSFVNAEKVSKKLGVPFILLDVRKEFKEEVIKNFIEEYKRGRTPNPCVICNERVKFNLTIKKSFKEKERLQRDTMLALRKKRGDFYLKRAFTRIKTSHTCSIDSNNGSLKELYFP